MSVRSPRRHRWARRRGVIFPRSSDCFFDLLLALAGFSPPMLPRVNSLWAEPATPGASDAVAGAIAGPTARALPKQQDVLDAQYTGC